MMVQEFHVLRCYSCQTFQVQQVKKSTKWNCKMCGEKQSVIKEFGRGSGVDCRRHVQKLNARRGETLVEQDQKALSHWEAVGNEAGEDCEDRPQDHDQREACSKVEEPSRWGKYLVKPGEGQAEEEEEEEEEENVFMDRNQIQGNINVGEAKSPSTVFRGTIFRTTVRTYMYSSQRKRKWQHGGNRYHRGDEDTMAAPSSWRTAKSAKQTRYSSSFTPVEKSHEAPASRGPGSGYTPPTSFTSSKPPPTSFTSSKPPLTSFTSSDPPPTSFTSSKPPLTSFTSSDPPPTSFTSSRPPPTSFTSSKPPLTSFTSSDPPPTSFTSSKPPSTVAPNRLNVVTSSHPRSSGSTTISKVSKWAQFMTAPPWQDEEDTEGESFWMRSDEAGNVESDVDPFHNNDSVTLSCGGVSAVGLGSVVGGAYSRLKSTLSHCGFGEETNSKRDPSLTRMSPKSTEPICDQPQPTKPPGPSLTVGSLFNTGEDFDDTFDLDDLKVEPAHAQGVI